MISIRFFLLLFLVFVSACVSSSGGLSDGGNPISSVTQPSGLALNPTDISMQLSWNRRSDAITYEIYRSLESPVLFTLIGEVDSSSFTDTVLSANVTYLYKIRGVNNRVYSPFSGIVSGMISNTVRPSAPTVNVVAEGATIQLSFSSMSPDVTYFNVYRALSSGGDFIKINASRVYKDNVAAPIRGFYNDSTIIPGQMYFYKVKAIDFAGSESDFSSVVNAGLAIAGGL